MYFCTAKRRVFLLKITSLAEHKIIQEVRYMLNGLCMCVVFLLPTPLSHNFLFQLLITISLIVYGRKKKEEPKKAIE